MRRRRAPSPDQRRAAESAGRYAARSGYPSQRLSRPDHPPGEPWSLRGPAAPPRDSRACSSARRKTSTNNEDVSDARDSSSPGPTASHFHRPRRAALGPARAGGWPGRPGPPRPRRRTSSSGSAEPPALPGSVAALRRIHYECGSAVLATAEVETAVPTWRGFLPKLLSRVRPAASAHSTTRRAPVMSSFSQAV
jgi:hypothetical protein